MVLNISFDFGGLLGGIIGVIGAYGAARYQFNKQEKAQEPSKHKKTYELCIKLSVHLSSIWDSLESEDFRHNDLLRNVITFNNQLQKFLAEAIETDKRLVALITNTIDGLMDICKEYSLKPRDHEHFMECESKLMFFAEAMRLKCHEIRDAILGQNTHDY